MLSTFLSGFNFRHFTFPHRTQNQEILFYSDSIASRFLRHVQFAPFDSNEKDWAEFLTADQTLFKYGGQLELNMLYKKWIEKWRSYRYRFVPWITLNLKKRLDDPLFVYSLHKPAISLQYDTHFARTVLKRVFQTSLFN